MRKPVRRARRKLHLYRGVVPAPPGIVMVAPPEVPRNASRVPGEGRAREGPTKRGQGQYKGRSP